MDIFSLHKVEQFWNMDFVPLHKVKQFWYFNPPLSSLFHYKTAWNEMVSTIVFQQVLIYHCSLPLKWQGYFPSAVDSKCINRNTTLAERCKKKPNSTSN